MASEVNEEGRAKALKYYKIMAAMEGLLGAGMLTCGIIAAGNMDEDIFGPPYFIGGFIVGIMALVAALLCVLVIQKAPSAGSDVQKQELRCAMMGHYMLSFFMIMGCFMGTVLAGIGGFGFDNDRSSLNKTLAVVILIGCIVGLLFTIFSLCIVCTYGQYFGIVITSGRRGRTMIVTTNQGGMFGGGGTTTATVYQSDFGTGGMGGATHMGGAGTGNSAQIAELQLQNQLLQQQLDLQRQLNEQQQHHHQPPPQYGFTQPPPPDMYNTPSAPPPSYNEVKQ